MKPYTNENIANITKKDDAFGSTIGSNKDSDFIKNLDQDIKKTEASLK